MSKVNFVFLEVAKLVFGFSGGGGSETFLVFKSPDFAYVDSVPLPVVEFGHGVETFGLFSVTFLEGLDYGGDEFLDEAWLLEEARPKLVDEVDD